MTAVVITGMAAVRPAPDAEPFPDEEAGHPVHRVADFDPVTLFGRRAARYNHRSTLLAMAACEAALAHAGLKVDDEGRDAIGITVGTTVGSVSGTIEFGMDTFDEKRPYLVNAACFPNAVLNTAAGALAIRLGARGPNATIAGGPLACVAALRHGEVTLRAGHAETVLAGASEEATEPALWWARGHRDTAAAGEGAAMFVVERLTTARAAGRAPIARLGAAVVRAADPHRPGALAAAIAEALRLARVDPADVALAALRATGVAAVDQAQRTALRDLTAATPLWSEAEIGDCYSAHSALQLVQVIDHLGGDARARRRGGSGQTAGLVIAVDPDGAVGVIAVTRDRADADADTGDRDGTSTPFDEGA